VQMFLKSGFKMRKWVSNSKEVLKRLAPEVVGMGTVELPGGSSVCERTLGIKWLVEADEFSFQFQKENRSVTRRVILSATAGMFDPLGLVSPLILTAKIILQQLCKLGLGWDVPVEGELLQRWLNWEDAVVGLGEIKFNRCMLPLGSSKSGSRQLHIFADASEVGYGVAAYIRYESHGVIESNLLMAKSRVAPLKVVTIPRLELNAAVLAVRIGKVIQRELNIEYDKIVYWTDSMIVLRYLHNVKNRFATYVANRVQEIIESSGISQWRHVQSENNPADIASRGLLGHRANWELWAQGPEFLVKGENEWPVTEIDSINVQDF
jgi:hypothetical protein